MHAFSGRQEAWTAVAWLDRPTVEAALDPDLTLAPVGDTRHPVVFSFGLQTEVQPAFASRLPAWLVPPRVLGRTQMAYREVIVAIPGVRPRRASDPSEIFTWLPVLWLDHVTATALGRLAGLSKVRAAISWNPRPKGLSVQVTLEGRKLVAAEFDDVGAPMPALAAPAIAQSPLPHLIARPLVGRTVLGNWVTTTLDWNLASARVRSAKARVELEPGAVGGLPSARHAVDGIGDGVLGAYVLEHTWTVTVPVPLRRTAHSVAPHAATHFARTKGARR
jgi:hypothetical protein